jgi:hypothetical protein
LTASTKGGVKLELDEANAMIMAARAHWFDGEAASDGETPESAPEAE